MLSGQNFDLLVTLRLSARLTHSTASCYGLAFLSLLHVAATAWKTATSQLEDMRREEEIYLEEGGLR